MKKGFGVPDETYLKFRLITDRSECGNLLNHDVKTLILERYLKEECIKCRCCKEMVGIVSIQNAFLESLYCCGTVCFWKYIEVMEATMIFKVLEN